jgi:hypothetical protein
MGLRLGKVFERQPSWDLRYLRNGHQTARRYSQLKLADY